MVFLENPVMRDTPRIELPSTKAAMMRVRSSRLLRFILTIMLERATEVKGGRGAIVRFLVAVASFVVPNVLQLVSDDH